MDRIKIGTLVRIVTPGTGSAAVDRRLTGRIGQVLDVRYHYGEPAAFHIQLPDNYRGWVTAVEPIETWKDQT